MQTGNLFTQDRLEIIHDLIEKNNAILYSDSQYNKYIEEFIALSDEIEYLLKTKKSKEKFNHYLFLADFITNYKNLLAYSLGANFSDDIKKLPYKYK